MPLFRCLRLLVLVVALPLLGSAASSHDNARRAQSMLGPEVWSRVIRVENSAVVADYPRNVFALVFELGGMLWLYTDANGTQSFSVKLDHLAADKRNFVPLLRAIHPGFQKYTVLPPGSEPAVGACDERLPNGCFIESYAALRECLDGADRILDAQLLSIYVKKGGALHGHTVLFYETPRGAYVLDPDEPVQPFPIGADKVGDPVQIARAVYGKVPIERARWVPTTLPGGSLVAFADGSPRHRSAARERVGAQDG